MTDKFYSGDYPPLPIPLASTPPKVEVLEPPLWLSHVKAEPDCSIS